MARVKNARGGPGDEDPMHSPRLPIDSKGKATKKTTTKKRKYLDAETARAAAVAEAAERAERGGARSGVVIADPPPSSRARIERVEHLLGSPPRTITVAGQHYTIDEGQPQGASQQQPQTAEQTQEGEQAEEAEETEQAPQPQLRRSGRTRVPVSPRPPT